MNLSQSELSVTKDGDMLSISVSSSKQKIRAWQDIDTYLKKPEMCCNSCVQMSMICAGRCTDSGRWEKSLTRSCSINDSCQ